jgi:histidinol phosphatase-like enzyme
VSAYGRLPDGAGLAKLRKRDTAAFLPGVQFRYLRELEPPDVSEGFSRVEIVPFERRVDPACNVRALVIWCDGVLLRSRSGQRTPACPDDVDVGADRAAVLRRYRGEGWRLLGLSWQPEIAEGRQSHDGVRAIVARMNDLLGLEIEVEFCPHAAGPPRCWCRKPLPGLGVVLVHRHSLDPAQCVYVGAGAQDPGFARRLGFRYRDAEEFFASDVSRSS